MHLGCVIWWPYIMGFQTVPISNTYFTPLSVLGVRLPVLNLTFECMDVLSLGNMLIWDPSLPAYIWTQKASTSSRLQLEGDQGLAAVESVNARQTLLLLVLRGSSLCLGDPMGQPRPCGHSLVHTATTGSFISFLSYTEVRAWDGTLISMGIFLYIVVRGEGQSEGAVNADDSQPCKRPSSSSSQPQTPQGEDPRCVGWPPLN